MLYMRQIQSHQNLNLILMEFDYIKISFCIPQQRSDWTALVRARFELTGIWSFKRYWRYSEVPSHTSGGHHLHHAGGASLHPVWLPRARSIRGRMMTTCTTALIWPGSPGQKRWEQCAGWHCVTAACIARHPKGWPQVTTVMCAPCVLLPALVF